MPNMKNAKKAVRKNTKRTNENNTFSASMKTAIKKVEKAVSNKNKETATKNLKTAIKSIDKATSKGVTSKNASARNKARLTKKVNSIE